MAGQDIHAVHAALARGILGDPIDPWLYEDFIWGPHKSNPSENWHRLAAAADLSNRCHGHPTSCIEPEAREYWRMILRPEHGLFGVEDYSRIYTAMNAEPMRIARECFRRLGWTDLLSAATIWCEDFARHCALACGWGPGRTLSDAIHEQSGPATFVGDGPIAARHGGLPFCAFAGRRSWNRADMGGGQRAWVHLDTGPLIQIAADAIGREPTGASDLWPIPTSDAMRRAGWNASWASSQLTDLCRRAAANDVTALIAVVGGIQWLPRDEYLLIRRSGGVEWVRLSGQTGPTAQLDVCTWAADGVVTFCGANNGYRTGQIFPSRVTVQGPEAAPTGYVAALGSDPSVRATCGVTGGEVVFALRIGGSGVRVLVPAPSPSPPPAPTPAPSPTPAPPPGPGEWPRIHRLERPDKWLIDFRAPEGSKVVRVIHGGDDGYGVRIIVEDPGHPE